MKIIKHIGNLLTNIIGLVVRVVALIPCKKTITNKLRKIADTLDETSRY